MKCSVSPTTCAAKVPWVEPEPPGGPPRRDGLREASLEFAALLWEQVLKAFQDSMLPGLAAGPAGPVYAGLVVETLARQVAAEGGLADQLYRALAGRQETAPGGEEGNRPGVNKIGLTG